MLMWNVKVLIHALRKLFGAFSSWNLFSSQLVVPVNFFLSQFDVDMQRVLPCHQFLVVNGSATIARTCFRGRDLWSTMPTLWQLEGFLELTP